MKLASIYVGIALGAMALAGAGCSGGPECGQGTIEVDEACLPAEDVCGAGSVYDPQTGQCEATTACATGTEYQDGECVPDGTVVCETGTTFDPETGTCVADVTGCAEGTVQVGDECVPRDDTLVADVEEPAEPNDTDGFGTVPVPDQDGQITVSGCVEPYDQDGDGEPDVDLDGFRMSVTEPMLLRVTVDGLDGLAGGFLLESEIAELSADDWQRFGLSMVDDTSQRQVYLPAAGDYLFFFSDSRSLHFGTPAGGDDTCYFATIEHLATPAAEPITANASGTFGATAFYEFTAQRDGELLQSVLAANSGAAAGSVVALTGGDYANSDGGSPAATVAGGLLTGDEVTLVVEPVYDFSLTPVVYDLTLDTAIGVELQNGAPTELAYDPDGAFDTALGNLAWFEATGGEIVDASFTASAEVDVGLFDANLEFLGLLCNAPCVAGRELIQIPEDGVYYWDILNVTDPAPAEGELYTVTASWTSEAVTATAVGTAAQDVPLSANGNDFYELPVEDMAWLVATGEPTGFGGALEVVLYPRDVAGVLDSFVPGEAPLSFTSGGGEEYGRIFDFATPSQTFLVRVRDAGFDGTADSETYDLAVNERPHTVVDLSSGPFSAAALAIDANATHYYLVQAASRERVAIDATNVVAADIAIHQLSSGEMVLDTADAGGAAAAERSGRFVSQPAWFAMAVEERGGASGSYDLAMDYDEVDVTASVDVGAAFSSTPQDAMLEVPDSCTIEAVTLDVATTAYDIDTALELTSPAGTTRYPWWSSAFNFLPMSGNFPFDYTPDEALDYSGEEAAGTWTLTFYNSFIFPQGGTLESFGLNFYCAP